MSTDNKARTFLRSINWPVSYENTESAARSVAEAAQIEIDNLRSVFQMETDKLKTRIAELKSNPFGAGAQLVNNPLAEPAITPFMHYAAAAMNGLLSNKGIMIESGGNNYETIVRWASGYAAAMIGQHHPKNVVDELNKKISDLQKELDYYKQKPLS